MFFVKKQKLQEGLVVEVCDILFQLLGNDLFGPMEFLWCILWILCEHICNFLKDSVSVNIVEKVSFRIINVDELGWRFGLVDERIQHFAIGERPKCPPRHKS